MSECVFFSVVVCGVVAITAHINRFDTSEYLCTLGIASHSPHPSPSIAIHPQSRRQSTVISRTPFIVALARALATGNRFGKCIFSHALQKCACAETQLRI